MSGRAREDKPDGFVDYLRSRVGRSPAPDAVLSTLFELSEQLNALERTPGVDMDKPYGLTPSGQNPEVISLRELRRDNAVLHESMRDLLQGSTPIGDAGALIERFWSHGVNASEALGQLAQAHPGSETEKAARMAETLEMSGLMLKEIASAHEAGIRVASVHADRVASRGRHRAKGR